MKLSTFIINLICSMIPAFAAVISGLLLGYSEEIIWLVSVVLLPLFLIIFLMLDLTFIRKEK